MKFNSKLNLISHVLFVTLVFFVFTSFKTSKPTCTANVSFHPITCNFSGGVDNCNGVDGNTNILAGSYWQSNVNLTGCGSLNISTVFPSVHPAGTLTISRSGVSGYSQITHSVAVNQSIAFDDAFDANCGDAFKVEF